MYIIQLTFTDQKHRANDFMDGHKAWINKGFDEDVFLLVGSLEGGTGGCILAHNITPSELKSRIQADPFVKEQIVQPHMQAVTPVRAEERFAFLMSESQSS